jgi:HEAT repeat protein
MVSVFPDKVEKRSEMAIIRRLFGGKKSIQDSQETVITKDIEEVLADLKSSDLAVRLMAMSRAARVLGQEEPGALKPYLFALKDEEAILRGGVVTQLAEAATDGLTKDVLRRAVKDSEEGHQLIDLLKYMSEKDSEEFVRDEAKRALDNIYKCLEKV